MKNKKKSLVGWTYGANRPKDLIFYSDDCVYICEDIARTCEGLCEEGRPYKKVRITIEEL